MCLSSLNRPARLPRHCHFSRLLPRPRAPCRPSKPLKKDKNIPFCCIWRGWSARLGRGPTLLWHRSCDPIVGPHLILLRCPTTSPLLLCPGDGNCGGHHNFYSVGPSDLVYLELWLRCGFLSLSALMPGLITLFSE